MAGKKGVVVFFTSKGKPQHVLRARKGPEGQLVFLCGETAPAWWTVRPEKRCKPEGLTLTCTGCAAKLEEHQARLAKKAGA